VSWRLIPKWDDFYQTSASSLPSQDDDEVGPFTGAPAFLVRPCRSIWNGQLNLIPAIGNGSAELPLSLIDAIMRDGYLERVPRREFSHSPRSRTRGRAGRVEMVLPTRFSSSSPVGVGARSLTNAQACNCASCTKRNAQMLEQGAEDVKGPLELLGSPSDFLS